MGGAGAGNGLAGPVVAATVGPAQPVAGLHPVVAVGRQPDSPAACAFTELDPFFTGEEGFSWLGVASSMVVEDFLLKPLL